MKSGICRFMMLCLLLTAVPSALAAGEAHDNTRQIISLCCHRSDFIDQAAEPHSP